MAIIEVGVDGFLFLLSMSIQLDNPFKLDPVFLNDELARIENKEGVNFMLYYQSGGPKNKGEVLEDENRMILLRLPKKNVGTQGLLQPSTLPHQVDCIVQLHASSVVLIIRHPHRWSGSSRPHFHVMNWSGIFRSRSVFPSMAARYSFFKETTKPLTSGRRPWSVFLDLTLLNIPFSIHDTTTRITQNVLHFSVNYSIILLIILSLSILNHPLVLIALFITLIAWLSLYFSREEPLWFLGYQVSDWMVLVVLFVVDFLVVIWGGVFQNVVVGGGIAVVLMLLHAALRSTDDLVADDIETSPYAKLALG
ncbi:hypothetical protein NC652_024475 [Populus alba x Populus x berolinensis]|nr:hypothetical protein NC652_024475 [Populus alba x Populus x berolinensis]